MSMPEKNLNFPRFFLNNIFLPLLEAPDFTDKISVSGRIGLNDIFDIVRFESFFESAPGRHVFELLKNIKLATKRHFVWLFLHPGAILTFG